MSGANFNATRTHRTRLWRRWNENLPWLNVIGLNPSGANEIDNDPTIVRQIERAKLLGCGGLLMNNAYDLVSTDPMAMLKHSNPLTENNDIAIITDAWRTVHSEGKVIAGWGRHIQPDRQVQLLKLLEKIPLWCLKINQDGTPKHPLYCAYSAPLLEFRTR